MCLSTRECLRERGWYMESNWERAVCTVLRGRGKKKHHSSLDPPVMHDCTTVHVRTTRTSTPLSLIRIHLTLNAMGHQTMLLFPLYTHMFSHLPLSIFGPKKPSEMWRWWEPPQRKIVGIFFLRRSSLSSGGKEERASVGWGKPRGGEREKEELWGGNGGLRKKAKGRPWKRQEGGKKGGFRSSVCGCVLQWSLAPEVGGGEGKEYQAFPSLHDAPLAQ